MTTYNLWQAKNLTKRIEKYTKYLDKVQACIKRDKTELRTVLKRLTKKENLEYGYQNGFIEKADYEVMKTKIGR